ncbi:MAG TPA: tRNA pseudouridine(55) synthase TruB [Acidimicrobiales bacterium]|nr:tRNA pseudouridine(55) synthase TruB [Acidimicrobiales bacterium]
MTSSNGLLLIDKPAGVTSHDVVARVRHELHQKKVGHAGTLDPMATGLLILAVGPSTRLLRFAQSEVKRYTGTVQLGVTTDSLDADGEIIDEMEVPALDAQDVQRAATAMLGAQLQTPPMVSALKVGGRRLHELARQGIEVERTPREVTIFEFRVTPSSDRTRWDFDVRCSVGTYVRVLLSDLAGRLGTCGHLTALRRLASGSHDVREAVTLERLHERLESGESVLLAPRAFVEHLEHVQVDEDEERRLRMGQMLELAGNFATSEIAAVNSAGDLVGILRRRGEHWKPELVLPERPTSGRG